MPRRCPKASSLPFVVAFVNSARLDPNKRYVDLLGRPVEAAPRFYPEGLDKLAMDSQGDFPQNGHRIPLFGEAVEVAAAAHVHIDTAKTTTFPASVPSWHGETHETHGLPDPLAQPLEDRLHTFKVCQRHHPFSSTNQRYIADPYPIPWAVGAELRPSRHVPNPLGLI